MAKQTHSQEAHHFAQVNLLMNALFLSKTSFAAYIDQQLDRLVLSHFTCYNAVLVEFLKARGLLFFVLPCKKFEFGKAEDLHHLTALEAH